MRVSLLGLLFALWATVGRAQTPAAPVSENPQQAAPKRQLAAVRVEAGSVKLDGNLDEAVWLTAPIATDFIQNRPNPGPHEKHPTEVRILYDDANLYVGAIMHDVSPDSILREMGTRDGFGNTDFFGIFLDTYRDKLNGYGFFVTPAGVQMDARYSPAGGEDFSWDAVWDSRTALRGTDWVAEMRIPYSAIRFSQQDEQLWGLQFMRQRKRENQAFFWNEVRPAVDGFVNQWGELTGLRDVKPPLRLSLTPYVSAYLDHYPYNVEGVRNTTSRFNGGADVKWGINESFTLDATLVPDFGQAQSDNRVLNLSPFEVQFNENRQFFTEGTELFNKGNLFYSRRVGATPIGYYGVEGRLRPGEKIVNNPDVAQLINATKVSGRTRKGLGVGIFNAVSREMHATVRNADTGEERELMTQPLTNFNIVVLDQSLRNNSYLSLINTNVTRAGQTFDANVTGGLFRFANKANAYAVDGGVVYSRRRGLGFNSERQVAQRDGMKYNLSVGKISGNLTWNVNHSLMSDTYNHNDLGLLFNNNTISQGVQVNYNKYKPFWKVNNLSTWVGVYENSLFRPMRYAEAELYAGANTTFTKQFLTVGINLNASPGRHDFFEPRTSTIGEYYVDVPASSNIGGFISSDYRKKLALDVNGGMRFFAPDGDRSDRRSVGVNIAPRYRVNNQLTFRYNLNYNVAQNQIGYVNGGLDASLPEDRPFLNSILLGRRRVTTIVNTLTVSYVFTNRMSLNVRTRHYNSHVRYHDFSTLGQNGEETPAAYSRNRDKAYNAFNVDAVFLWWFAPGSQVSVVWKNAAATEDDAERATPLYFDNLSGTLVTPHNNSLSVKVLYFLDYLALRRHRS
ncbi:hypothetical protein GCM10023185_30460 [Hymenobacter saemangeumensis]|uniref:Hydrolase n=1 Tax=Hymenobacter saemangeumensis TaxID=1084522 RepID=A0ABP8ILJ3_9BACT